MPGSAVATECVLRRLAAAGHDARADGWLSQRLGRVALRIMKPAAEPTSSATLAAALGAFDCFADAKIDVGDIPLANILADAGFRVVDTLLTFGGHVASPLVARCTMEIRDATPGDANQVADIAARSFRYSRFHLDPRVPKTVAAAVKRDWASAYFHGLRGDRMLVAAAEDDIRAFLLLITPKQGPAVIDLVAVASEWQGQGIGRAIVEMAGGLCGQQGLVVGTQAANIPSQRLYHALGFRALSAQYVMHYHGQAA